MIALLLACSFLWPATGPVCSAADEQLPCKCSEEFHWYWEDGHAPAEAWVQVRRCIPATETCEYQPAIHYTTWTDPDDGQVYTYRPDRWFPWRDAVYPSDRAWEYSVRNCKEAAAITCSAWGGYVQYRPPPDSAMRCYRNGVRVIPCR
jgi:hypothetical protein